MNSADTQSRNDFQYSIDTTIYILFSPVSKYVPYHFIGIFFLYTPTTSRYHKLFPIWEVVDIDVSDERGENIEFENHKDKVLPIHCRLKKSNYQRISRIRGPSVFSSLLSTIWNHTTSCHVALWDNQNRPKLWFRVKITSICYYLPFLSLIFCFHYHFSEWGNSLNHMVPDTSDVYFYVVNKGLSKSRSQLQFGMRISSCTYKVRVHI